MARTESALSSKRTMKERLSFYLKRQAIKSTNRSHWGQVISKLFIYALLIAFSYIFMYPLLRMVSLSLMGQRDLLNPEVTWVPQRPSLHNFVIAGKVLLMPQSMLFSALISGLLALAQTVVSTLTGFAFARYAFRFKRLLFVLVILSFVIPVPLVVIPRLMVFTGVQNATGIQLIGTIVPQLLFAVLGQGVNSAILILICFNFFKNIPISLDEAAKIDGANARQVFWHIIVKLSFTIIITVFLFAFVWNWNETYQTSTFLRNGIPLVPQRLGLFESVFAQRGAELSADGGGEARVNEAYKMAGTLISILPLLILYFFTQRQFIEGIENTGIK